jgi:hypothetical protein
MNFKQFKESVSRNEPPAGLSIYLQALWFDAKGDWEKAHHLAQEADDSIASWIHAYLHRKEGDNFNADYWYRRAGKKRPSSTLEREWEDIVKALSESIDDSD